jgi:hypothetical protein
MKKIFSIIIISLFGIGVHAQVPTNYVSRLTRERLIAGIWDSTATVPSGIFPSIRGGGSGRSGALYVDTVGGGRGLWYYEGGTWKHVLDSASVVTGINARNGIRKSVDTLMLGDSLDRSTAIVVRSSLINNSRYNSLLLTNRDIGPFDPYTTALTYTPSTFNIRRVYGDQYGDVDSFFYGGGQSMLFQLFRDSTASEFGAGKRNELLPGLGIEAVGQYYPPRDTTVLKVGRDGQSGNLLFAQFDLGHSYGYNINVKSPSDLPDFPMSLIRSSMDHIRVIDNTRIKKMVGSGFTGYLPMWKTYQTAITGSTHEAGNYWSKASGIHIWGDAYPFIGAATTKEKILKVAKLDSAIGLVIEPMYRPENTAYNGYSIWAKGDSDRIHTSGFLSLGGPLPTKDNGLIPFNYRIWNNGKYWGTDTVHGGIVDAYGMSLQMPASIFTETGLNLTAKDSITTGTLGAYLPASRNSRGIYIRSEGFNSATYDNTGTGLFVQIETGANHANVTRWWRNGNMVIKRSAAVTDPYRLYKALVVNGSTALLDTLTIKNLISQAWDATNLKPLVADAAGNVYKTSAAVTTSLINIATLDFPNVVAQSSQDLTITVTGVTTGMTVALSVPNAETPTGTCVTAWVSATDTVTVRFNNYRATDYDPGSASFTVRVLNN